MTPLGLMFTLFAYLAGIAAFAALAFAVYVFYAVTMVIGVENRKKLIKGSCLDPEFEGK